jgi:AcrR family transcriptional regulator
MATTPRTKRQEQAIARREQLVGTAMRLFSEKGYQSTSVRDIARAAGVNEALLYHYFSSKGDLFRAVLDEYAPVRAFRVSPQPAASSQSAVYSFDDALRAYGREFAARIRESRPFIVTMLTEAPRDPELGDILRAFLQATNDDITRFLTGYREDGEVNERIPIEIAARVLQGSLMFHILTEVLRAPATPTGDDTNGGDDDKEIGDIVNVLLAGFAPR